MNIDLSELFQGTIIKKKFNEMIQIKKEYLESSDVLRIDPFIIEGCILRNSDDSFCIQCSASIDVYLEDAISLEEIKYPILLEIDENLTDFIKNDEKVLDITPILWENIVLEIPLKVTNVKDFTNFKGEGWKLIGEEDLRKEHNPFHDLIEGKEE